MAFSTATIQLFLNTAGAKDALSGFQRKFDSTIANIGKVALGLLGVRGLGGIYNQMQQIVQLSERWQLPVEKVSQFANAFSLFGGNAEGAAQTIEKFQQLANNLKFHSSGALRDLSAIIGVNLNNKDYFGVINAIRSQFGNLNKDAQVEVLDMLGMDDIALQRMLKASDAEFNQAMTEASEMGVVTDDLAKSLRDIEIGWARLKASLIAAFAPMLESLKPVLDGLNRLLNWFNKLDPKTKQWVAKILTAVVAIKSLGAALKLLNLGGMIGGLAGLATNPLGWIGLAAAAALVLAENWDKVTAAWDRFSEKAPAVTGTLKSVWNLVKTINDGIWSLGDWLDRQTGLKVDVNKSRQSYQNVLSGKYTAADIDASWDLINLLREQGKITPEQDAQVAELLQAAELAINKKGPQDMRAAQWLRAMELANKDTSLMPFSKELRMQAESDHQIYQHLKGLQGTQLHAGTINIYGVQGAEDMVRELENLPRNNMVATKGY